MLINIIQSLAILPLISMIILVNCNHNDDPELTNLDYEMNTYEKFIYYQQKLNIMMIGSVPQTRSEQENLYKLNNDDNKRNKLNHINNSNMTDNISNETVIIMKNKKQTIYIVDNSRFVHEFNDYELDSRGMIKSLSFLNYYENDSLNNNDKIKPLYQKWPALHSILNSIENSNSNNDNINLNNEKIETITFSLSSSLSYDSIDLEQFMNNNNSTDTNKNQDLGEYFVWITVYYHHHYQIHLYRVFNLLISDGFIHIHSYKQAANDNDDERIKIASTSEQNFTYIFEQSFNDQQLHSLRGRLITLDDLNTNIDRIIDDHFTTNIRRNSNITLNEQSNQQRSTNIICYRKSDSTLHLNDNDNCPNDMNELKLFIIQSFYTQQFLYLFDYQYVYAIRRSSRSKIQFHLEQIYRYSFYPRIFQQGSILFQIIIIIDMILIIIIIFTIVILSIIYYIYTNEFKVFLINLVNKRKTFYPIHSRLKALQPLSTISSSNISSSSSSTMKTLSGPSTTTTTTLEINSINENINKTTKKRRKKLKSQRKLNKLKKKISSKMKLKK